MLGGEGERLLQCALLWNESFGCWQNIVGEEEVRQIAKFAQRFNSSLHKRSDVAEIIVTENSRTQCRVEVFKRESTEIFAVEPPKLRQVEDGTAEPNIFYLEALHHLFERKLFCDRACAFRHAAAPQTKQVDHSLGEETGLAIINKRN